MLPPESAAQSASAAPVTAEVSEFDQLLRGGFKIRAQDADKQTAVQTAVRTLAQEALSSTRLISADVTKTIKGMIAEIDRKLSEQINQILHHEEFKSLEGTWRGLHHLVNNTETDEMLKIRVMNISKNDLKKTLKKFDGSSWDQSPIFRKLYEDEFGVPGGQPYGAVIADYYFSHHPEDVKMLGSLAQIGAAMHAPVITAAASQLFDLESWRELGDPAQIGKIFDRPEYAAWRSLRETDDARYLGLTMPRFLSRLPYGAKTSPVEQFDFEEDTDGTSHDKYVWSNAAYAMGVNITRAFKQTGWCSQIRGAESGGIVEGLPVHTFASDDGGVDTKCPTEIAITDRREAELAKHGFMPLSHYKNTDYAVFTGAQSLQKPQKYDDPAATANAELSARLPYLFAVSRFAHYLKVMVRRRVGSYANRADMEADLNKWINQYTCDPGSDENQKRRYPLAAAKVEVLDVPGNPGYYTSKFYLQPHYQLEGLTASLRLTSKLPSKA